MSAPPHPAEATTAAAAAENGSGGSSDEKCGFVLHVAMILVGAWYGMGLIAAPWLPPQGRSDDDQEVADEWPFWSAAVRDLALSASRPFWTRYVPTALLGLFVAAPVLYAAVNLRLVAPAGALESVQDDAGRPSSAAASCGPGADAVLVEFFRTARAARGDAASVPPIADLDVGFVNNLVWELEGARDQQLLTRSGGRGR